MCITGCQAHGVSETTLGLISDACHGHGAGTDTTLAQTEDGGEQSRSSRNGVQVPRLISDINGANAVTCAQDQSWVTTGNL